MPNWNRAVPHSHSHTTRDTAVGAPAAVEERDGQIIVTARA